MAKPKQRRARAGPKPVRATITAVPIVAARAQAASTGSIEVRLFDGARQPWTGGIETIIRLFDGRQRLVSQTVHTAAIVRFENLPVADNLDDRWTVLVSADNFAQIGFTPVVLKAGMIQRVDLMLVAKAHRFDFTRATWTQLSASDPALVAFLSAGATSAADAKNRYEALMRANDAAVAALLNLWTAMTTIVLPDGVVVDYLKALEWTTPAPAQDRFFCYADQRLVDEVVQAADQGTFAAEINPAIFHPGATRSYKQIQFGEANVQLTFHEQDIRVIDGVTCVLLEPDIDYFKDLLAHGLLEVLPNITSDPLQVYILRWIAGRHAGVPEFDPPYAVVTA